MNTKETDPIVEEAVEKFARRMREKAAEFRAAYAKLTNHQYCGGVQEASV